MNQSISKSNPAASYQDELPVLHVDHDLPVLLPTSQPIHLPPAQKVYPAWRTFASQRYVRAMAVSVKRDIWLATAGGVLRWWADRQQFRRYGSEHGLPGNAVLSIAVDGNGRVWAATQDHGLCYLEDERWLPYESILESLAEAPGESIWPPFGDMRRVNALTVDAKGQLWVAKPHSLYLLAGAPEERQPVQALPLPAGTPPYSLAISAPDQIWLSQARGVFHYEDGQWKRYLDWPDVLHLALQGDNLWLGTRRGLIQLHLPTNESTTHLEFPITALALPPLQLPPNLGRESGVWFAIDVHQKILKLEAQSRRGAGSRKLKSQKDYLSGLRKGRVGYASPKVKKEKHGEGNEGTKVKWLRMPYAGRITTLMAHENNLWLGSEQGLLFGGPKITFQRTKEPPDEIGITLSDLPAKSMSHLIHALAVVQNEQQTQLWIGTSHDLLSLTLRDNLWRRYNPQGVEQLVVSHDGNQIWSLSQFEGVYHLLPQQRKQPSQIFPPLVFALTASPSGQLWVATTEGIYRQEASEWQLVLPIHKWPRSHVRVLAQAYPFDLWIGTANGLFVARPDTTVDTILPQVSVQALLAIPQAKGEFLWVGTEQGLYAGTANQLSSCEPLTNYPVTALAWDATNHLIWVGSETALFALTPDGTKRHEFTVRNSGLSANRVTALALSTTDDGQTRLWIGTSCGLSSYTYPAQAGPHPPAAGASPNLGRGGGS